MLRLILVATLPVMVGTLISGVLGARLGTWALWAGILAAICLAVLGLGLQEPSATSAIGRWGTPLAVFAPAFILAGCVLSLQGLSTLTLGRISSIAVIIGLANLFLAQFFFVLGCTGDLWECP